MSFKLKNTSDKTVIHENNLSEKDFYPEKIKDEWVRFTQPFGEVKMKQWTFDGVRMGYSDWTFTKPVSFDWEGNIEVVTMYFSLKGSVSIGSNATDAFELKNAQQNMFYGTEASGFMKVDELRLKSFMVQFNKDAFLRIAGGGTDALKYFADQVSNRKTTSFSQQPLPVDINTQVAIDAIMNCKFSDSLKRVFFLSKAMELLVLQADLHAQSLIKKTSHVKTDYDRDRIHFAKEYMLQHIDMPPTIPELAKIAGINEFKLKKGYKEMFGTTIFGQLAETRLQLSKAALYEGNKSITEIAFELGYSSVQHFSAAFKKRFGDSPLSVKNKK